MYGSGRAEELTGKAIAGRRDEVFLVSKVLPSNASYEGTLRACERSLTRLGTDRLDLYLLHWESSYPIGETMRAMERLIDDGQIRFAGVSNFDVAELKAAQAAMRHHKLASNQVLYHLKERGIERKLIPYCQAQGIAVVALYTVRQDEVPAPRFAGRSCVGVHRQTPRTDRAAGDPEFPHAAGRCLHDSKGGQHGTHAGKRRRRGMDVIPRRHCGDRPRISRTCERCAARDVVRAK